jgi:hypothetical protein
MRNEDERWAFVKQGLLRHLRKTPVLPVLSRSGLALVRPICSSSALWRHTCQGGSNYKSDFCYKVEGCRPRRPQTKAIIGLNRLK